MVSRRRTTPEPEPKPRRKPATTPDGRENQLIAMAVDLTERRLTEGTASAQEIVHFLRLGSTREKLEQEKISREVELLRAKSDATVSADRIEKLYTNAINAMRSYQGQTDMEYEDDPDL